MALGLQRGGHIGRDRRHAAGLVVDACVGPVIKDTGSINGLLDIHVVVDNVGDDLGHGGPDAQAAG